MAILVGDIIISTRELIPDLPRGLSVTTSPSPTVAVVVIGGSTLPSTSYYVKATFVDRWGETQPGTEQGPFFVPAGSGLRISNVVLPSGPDTKLRVYIGTSINGENMMYESASVPFDISAPGVQNVPPTRSSNFYPDADGGLISTPTLYRWLNESLEEACKISGGIPDETGVATVNGQGMYTLDGLWNKLTDAWWDGYPASFEGQEALFYRNMVSGYANRAVLKLVADRIVFEVQPQPNRSGGTTTLAADLGLSATSATLTATTLFLLPLGLLKIGSEIVSFANFNGNIATGLIRGIGGTTQAAWPAGTAVSELNFRTYGLRQFTNPTYFAGDCAKTLVIPAGWRTGLVSYLLYKARKVEQRYQEAKEEFQTFAQLIQGTARGNRLVAGPRQVGGPGIGAMESYPSAGLGGRLIIP